MAVVNSRRYIFRHLLLHCTNRKLANPTSCGVASYPDDWLAGPTNEGRSGVTEILLSYINVNIKTCKNMRGKFVIALLIPSVATF